MIELELNKLFENNLTPNEFVYLHYIHKNYPREGFESSLDIDLNKLESADWIKITPEAVILRSKFQQLFGDRDTILSVNSWIQEWIDLWPNGVKSGGKPVKGDTKSISKKMTSFIQSYKSYTKEQILNATKIYLQDRQAAGWSFIMIAHYFISKDGNSTLASWIEDIDKREIQREFYTQI